MNCWRPTTLTVVGHALNAIRGYQMMMHAPLLGRAQRIAIGVGVALALASLPLTGTQVPSAVVAFLLTSGLGAYWIIRRGPRPPGRPSRLEWHRQSQAEERRAYDVDLEAWGRRSDERAGLEEGHCRRVAALAVRFARELGLDDAAITNVRRGALLHDVGMLGIPASVLLKAGPLTTAEREIVEQHPIIARDLLLDDPLLESALAIPYSHHERWDGEGYPLGLAGEAIPLAARLFTVVDHWSALTTDRPFRRAWPRSAAMGYLRCSAGSVSDPRMVDAFLRLLERTSAPG
jgi:HD-GYP domain-containing protein (c-di-GMP phosphodiesterase class II)